MDLNPEQLTAAALRLPAPERAAPAAWLNAARLAASSAR